MMGKVKPESPMVIAGKKPASFRCRFSRENQSVSLLLFDSPMILIPSFFDSCTIILIPSFSLKPIHWHFHHFFYREIHPLCWGVFVAPGASEPICPGLPRCPGKNCGKIAKSSEEKNMFGNGDIIYIYIYIYILWYIYIQDI